MTWPRNFGRSLQHDEFEYIGVILSHHRRARDRGSDSRCFDRGPARTLGHAQEHGAGVEINGARAFVEGENRVRPQTRDRQVGKLQLAARIGTRADGGAAADLVIHRGRP